MYAIIQDSGRQYRVVEGQEIELDYREAEPGTEMTFDRVLAVAGESGLKTGKPNVDGATVSATILGGKLGEKLYVQKLRRRKNSRRRTGHRQIYTRVRIDKIQA